MQRVLLKPSNRWRLYVCGLLTCPFVEAGPQAYCNNWLLIINWLINRLMQFVMYVFCFNVYIGSRQRRGATNSNRTPKKKKRKASLRFDRSLTLRQNTQENTVVCSCVYPSFFTMHKLGIWCRKVSVRTSISISVRHDPILFWNSQHIVDIFSPPDSLASFLWIILRYSPRFFTARCTLVQNTVLRSHVVCLFVCPSVCDVGGLWSHRLEIGILPN